MSHLAELKIPLKPYLIKYLKQKYGDSHLVNRKSWLGIYFVEILDKQFRKVNTNISLDTFYVFHIPASVVQEVGFDISGFKLKRLSVMINKVFYNDLFSYVDVSVKSDLKFKNERQDSLNSQNKLKAIAQFLSFYNITEEELKQETVYKNLQRHQDTDIYKKVNNTVSV